MIHGNQKIITCQFSEFKNQFPDTSIEVYHDFDTFFFKFFGGFKIFYKIGENVHFGKTETSELCEQAGLSAEETLYWCLKYPTLPQLFSPNEIKRTINCLEDMVSPYVLFTSMEDFHNHFPFGGIEASYKLDINILKVVRGLEIKYKTSNGEYDCVHASELCKEAKLSGNEEAAWTQYYDILPRFFIPTNIDNIINNAKNTQT